MNLGIWQLNRLDQRQEQNNLYQTRLEEQPLSPNELQDLLARGTPKEDLEFRTIQLDGKYKYYVEVNEPDRESVVRNRTLMGRPGVWMLTPFEAAQNIFIVNRGWVPRELSSTDCRGRSKGEMQENPTARPPQGTVQIKGILRLPEGSNQESTEWKKCLPRVELSGHQDLTSIPFWVQLEEYLDFELGVGPTPLESPDRGNGPHLSYAIQWFIFATLLVVTYPLVIRSNHRKRNLKSSS